MGKSLRSMTPDQIHQVAARTNDFRTAVGYEINALSSPDSNEQYEVTVSPNLPEVSTLEALRSGISASLDVAPDATSVVINETFSIRQDSDKFGRMFSALRCEMTENDKKPLRTR